MTDSVESRHSLIDELQGKGINYADAEDLASISVYAAVSLRRHMPRIRKKGMPFLFGAGISLNFLRSVPILAGENEENLDSLIEQALRKVSRSRYRHSGILLELICAFPDEYLGRKSPTALKTWLKMIKGKSAARHLARNSDVIAPYFAEHDLAGALYDEFALNPQYLRTVLHAMTFSDPRGMSDVFDKTIAQLVDFETESVVCDGVIPLRHKQYSCGSCSDMEHRHREYCLAMSQESMKERPS